jgi:hypothetical protein
MIAPLLIHVDPSKPFVLETNTFDFAMSHNLEKIIFFIQLVSVLISFFLPKLTEIHDKKLLSIVDAFAEWHHLLQRAQHEITMYFNHKNLQYFMMVCVLN